VLERSGATEPEFLAHVMLRVCDVMREGFPVARQGEPVRAVGLAMAGGDLDLMPIVDDDGALVGVMTERALARRYIRESREVSSLVGAPTAVSAVVGGAGGGAGRRGREACKQGRRRAWRLEGGCRRGRG
jgi:manganese-dependent inorganic pyrophosphatase